MNHHLAILAVPGAQLLDVSGPLDVFAEANRLLNRAVYQLQVMSLVTNEDFFVAVMNLQIALNSDL